MKPPSPKQREALALVADGKFFPDFVREEDGWHARWRAVGDSDNPWVDEFVREPSVTALSEDAEDQKHETLHDAWAMALRSRTGLVRWDDAECSAFAAELAAWHGGAAEEKLRREIVFRFVPMSVACPVPRGRAALKALGESAYVWGPLARLRASGDGLAVTLEKSEAEDFLRRGARDLVDAGYSVEGVEIAAKVDVSADVTASDRDQGEVKLVVRVDGVPVTADEIRFLLEQNSTFVFFRDRWIEVDRGILREALKALEARGRNVASPLAFALGIGRVGALEIDECAAHGWLRGLVNELRGAKGLDGLAGRARAPVAIASRLVDARGICARQEEVDIWSRLRPYQRRGVAWMKFLTDHGFGALLADDMGLGKTIQTISWILANRGFEQPADASQESSNLPTFQPSNSPTLIIAPLTLLANWRHEFAKFAPELRVYVHQGDLRHVASGFRRAVAESDVTVTSYNLLVKDYPLLADVAWDALVLDEAQTIKNCDTRAARAVRALLPPKRVALTGTPIENTVEDVWSIEDFLNPGFLGDRKSFAERFLKPLAADPNCTAGKRLRHALEPFVLRRLKTDPAIAGEIGEKRQIKEYCALSPTQRVSYERALADYRTSEKRQGDVFALITELKLVCDGFDGARTEGGKVDRLFDLLEQIFANGESALVFTQYAKVGKALQDALAKKFGRHFPFLHGALSVKQREAEIAAFNGSPANHEPRTANREPPSAFILSLKAGGYGLNLVKATHVIHYDRWWNPAVENQATDRAHRIGQDKTVFVHEFITAGTLEERVDEILDRKSTLEGLLKDGEEFSKLITLTEST